MSSVQKVAYYFQRFHGVQVFRTWKCSRCNYINDLSSAYDCFHCHVEVVWASKNPHLIAVVQEKSNGLLPLDLAKGQNYAKFASQIQFFTERSPLNWFSDWICPECSMPNKVTNPLKCLNCQKDCVWANDNPHLVSLFIEYYNEHSQSSIFHNWSSNNTIGVFGGVMNDHHESKSVLYSNSVIIGPDSHHCFTGNNNIHTNFPEKSVNIQSNPSTTTKNNSNGTETSQENGNHFTALSQNSVVKITSILQNTPPSLILINDNSNLVKKGDEKKETRIPNKSNITSSAKEANIENIEKKIKKIKKNKKIKVWKAKNKVPPQQNEQNQTLVAITIDHIDSPSSTSSRPSSSPLLPHATSPLLPSSNSSITSGSPLLPLPKKFSNYLYPPMGLPVSPLLPTPPAFQIKNHSHLIKTTSNLTKLKETKSESNSTPSISTTKNENIHQNETKKSKKQTEKCSLDWICLFCKILNPFHLNICQNEECKKSPESTTKKIVYDLADEIKNQWEIKKTTTTTTTTRTTTLNEEFTLKSKINKKKKKKKKNTENKSLNSNEYPVNEIPKPKKYQTIKQWTCLSCKENNVESTQEDIYCCKYCLSNFKKADIRIVRLQLNNIIRHSNNKYPKLFKKTKKTKLN